MCSCTMCLPRVSWPGSWLATTDTPGWAAYRRKLAAGGVKKSNGYVAVAREEV